MRVTELAREVFAEAALAPSPFYWELVLRGYDLGVDRHKTEGYNMDWTYDPEREYIKKYIETTGQAPLVIDDEWINYYTSPGLEPLCSTCVTELYRDDRLDEFTMEAGEYPDGICISCEQELA
jgi:hypothetical protein